MSGMGIGAGRGFTPREFLRTGRELVVEFRGSLHTAHGKIGLAVFAVGILIGVYGTKGYSGADAEQDYLLLSSLWCAMGLVGIWNLQDYKLLYLLPIGRKEFAARQIRKMAWMSLVIFLILAGEYAFRGDSPRAALCNIIWKGIPAGIFFGGYQVVSAQPVKGSALNGAKMYGLSVAVLLLNCGAALFNLMFVVDSWSIKSLPLPVLNYGLCIYTVVYFYRKIAYAELYYDGLR